jgi:hypothetical protein
VLVRACSEATSFYLMFVLMIERFGQRVGTVLALTRLFDPTVVAHKRNLRDIELPVGPPAHLRCQ